jgi:trk system potassium uptake protein TrkH
MVICFGTFVGGSVGSTTGGIKVVRLLLIAKIIVAQIQGYLPSRHVRTLKLGHRTIDERTQERILLHVVLFGFVLIAGSIALMALESHGDIRLRTASTAALATLCTAGPGLGQVGPVHNYLWFTAPSKILMSFLMILGRLELLTFLAILTPRFWRAE